MLSHHIWEFHWPIHQYEPEELVVQSASVGELAVWRLLLRTAVFSDNAYALNLRDWPKDDAAMTYQLGHEVAPWECRVAEPDWRAVGLSLTRGSPGPIVRGP